MRYDNDQKANALAVLAANDGNMSAAARELGMARKSLEYIARRAGVRGVDADGTKRMGTEEDRQRIGDRWLKAAMANADEMANPEKIRKAQLNQNAVAAGVAFDKYRIVSGQSTGNVSVNHKVVYLPPDALARLSVEPDEPLEGDYKLTLPEGGSQDAPEGDAA